MCSLCANLLRLFLLKDYEPVPGVEWGLAFTIWTNRDCAPNPPPLEL